MRLGKAAAYGVYATLHIAQSDKDGPIQGRIIAKSCGIPVEYLLKILQQLVRAQVLLSERGRGGGFLLRRTPAQTSLLDIVEAIAEAGDRVLDVHMKDLADLLEAGSQCVVGEGAMPIPGIFRQLVAMGYDGYVNLEYEIDAANPLPGMMRSFAYMRGVLDGLGLAEG